MDNKQMATTSEMQYNFKPSKEMRLSLNEALEAVERQSDPIREQLTEYYASSTTKDY